MLSTLEDKTIEFFQFALDIIQMYDKEYQKQRHQLEQQSRKTGKKPDFTQRLEYVTNDFKSIFARYMYNGYEYTKTTKPYQFCEYYAPIIQNEVIIPIGEFCVLMFSYTEQKISLICKNIQESQFYEFLATKFNDVKITLQKQWMRLDFNCDGKVTIDDVKNTLMIIFTTLKVYYDEGIQQATGCKAVTEDESKPKKKKL